MRRGFVLKREEGEEMSELTWVVLVCGLIGIASCVVFAIDKERFWWAIIPGLGAFTLIAAMLADAAIGTDPENDWASVLVIAAGTAGIAMVLGRPDARRILAIVAVFALAIGILMTPMALAIRVILALMVAVVAGMALRGSSGHGSKTLKPS